MRAMKSGKSLDLMVYAFENWQDGPLPADGAIELSSGEEFADGSVEVIVSHPDEVAYAFYKKQEREHEEKTEQGMKYFHEHYSNLWW